MCGVGEGTRGRGRWLIGASRFSPQACEEHGVESGLLVARPSSATNQLKCWAVVALPGPQFLHLRKGKLLGDRRGSWRVRPCVYERSLCRENILVLDIFFEALNYETIEQKKAYEVAALLGKSKRLLHKLARLMGGEREGVAGGQQAGRSISTPPDKSSSMPAPERKDLQCG